MCGQPAWLIIRAMATDDRDEDTPSISRAEIIEQVQAAGLASRVIGQESENLDDAALADLVDELHRRTVVAEHTGTDIRDVGEDDFDDLVRAGNRAAFEDTTGVGYDRLTDLGKLVVDAELRDPTGSSSTGFDRILDDIVAGREGTAFVNPAGGSDGSGNGGGGGKDDGGGSAGFDDGFDDGFGGGSGDGSGTGTGASDDVTGGADDPEGAPPDGDGSGEDVDGTGGSDDPTGGGAGGQGDGGQGDGEQGGSVGTVFEVSVGSTENDPASDDFGEGPLTTFARGEDGTWYDEAGNEVTDPDSVAALEAQYESYQAQGGQDTPGEITPSGETHEEAVAGSDDDPDDEEEPDDAGGGVETTPNEDAPPPPPDDLDLSFQPGPKAGTTDPADDGGINSGTIDTSVGFPDKVDLIGQPGRDDLQFGGGAPGPVGEPGGPRPGQVDPVPDDGFGTGAGADAPGSGPEIDPFDRAGSFEPVDRPAPTDDSSADDGDDDGTAFARVELHEGLLVDDDDLLVAHRDLHRDERDTD